MVLCALRISSLFFFCIFSNLDYCIGRYPRSSFANLWPRFSHLSTYHFSTGKCDLNFCSLLCRLLQITFVSAYLIWILLQSSSSSWMLHIFKWGICEIWDFRIGEVDSQCKGGGTPCYIPVGGFIDGCYLWSKILWMQFAGTSWHELNYIRQAVGFLVKLIFFSDKKKCGFFFVGELSFNWFVFYAIFNFILGYTPEKKEIIGWNQAGSMPGTLISGFGFRFCSF